MILRTFGLAILLQLVRAENGHQIMQLFPQTKDQLEAVHDYYKDSDIDSVDFWHVPGSLNQSVDVMVNPNSSVAFKEWIDLVGVPYAVVVHNLERELLLKEGRPRYHLRQGRLKDDTARGHLVMGEYYSYKVIVEWMRDVVDRMPDGFAELTTVGRTTEGRAIHGIRVLSLDVVLTSSVGIEASTASSSTYSTTRCAETVAAAHRSAAASWGKSVSTSSSCSSSTATRIVPEATATTAKLVLISASVISSSSSAATTAAVARFRGVVRFRFYVDLVFSLFLRSGAALLSRGSGRARRLVIGLDESRVLANRLEKSAKCFQHSSNSCIRNRRMGLSFNLDVERTAVMSVLWVARIQKLLFPCAILG